MPKGIEKSIISVRGLKKVFDYGAIYMAPGLLETDGVHLSRKCKRFLPYELTGMIERAFN